MTAIAVLTLCQARGVQLIPDGDRIVLRGPKNARDEMRPAIRAHKLELLAALKADAKREPITLGLGKSCDGCGAEARIALVTDYGRFCRRCFHDCERKPS
jgi:hypothetical protein